MAVLVIILCGGLLAYIHRDDWRAGDGSDVFGGTNGQSADPAAACIEQRYAEIDAMVAEGVANDAKAALFKQRAEAMCRAAVSDGGTDFPLPIE